MKLLYADGAIAVIRKDAGELCEAGRGQVKGIPDLLREALGKDAYPVHRLDRESAGVMVYALTPQSAADISEQIRSGTFQKDYLAVLQGEPEKDAGELVDLLYYDRTKNKVFPVRRMRRGVKEARLVYRVKEKQGGTTLVEVHLLTGRTHQIRVQFALRKTPLYGDRKYGGQGEKVALFCLRISFQHPVTKAPCRLEELPDKTGIWERFGVV